MYYFASDMHLGLDYHTPSAEREKLVVRWLDEVSADARAIFLVGDVFDFWFEWKRVIPKGFTRLLGKLSELTDKGVAIHFFTGNHDMWAYGYLQAECGVRIHAHPEIFTLYDKKLFVAHGDNLYLSPPFAIRVMNHFFYSRLWRRAFGTLVHPDTAMRFGTWWSDKSRKTKSLSHGFAGEDEYLVRFARAQDADIDYFIFGHLHCPSDYDMGNGQRAVILGEWLVDPTYAVLKPDGQMELRQFSTSSKE